MPLAVFRDQFFVTNTDSHVIKWNTKISTRKKELIVKNGQQHRAQREKYMDNQLLESM